MSFIHADIHHPYIHGHYNVMKRHKNKRVELKMPIKIISGQKVSFFNFFIFKPMSFILPYFYDFMIKS